MPHPLTAPILAFANRLRFKHLFLVTGALFLLNLLIPDIVPFADELLLGLATLLLASWKKPAVVAPAPAAAAPRDSHAQRPTIDLPPDQFQRRP